MLEANSEELEWANHPFPFQGPAAIFGGRCRKRHCSEGREYKHRSSGEVFLGLLVAENHQSSCTNVECVCERKRGAYLFYKHLPTSGKPRLRAWEPSKLSLSSRSFQACGVIELTARVGLAQGTMKALWRAS